MENNSTKNTSSSFIASRYRVICFGIFCSLSVLLVRVTNLQFLNRSILMREANQRSLRTVILPTNRGTVVDRDGETLAMSVPSRDIVADPVKIIETSPDFNSPTWRYLASALNTNPRQIERKIYQNAHRHFIFLGRKIEMGIAQYIRDLNINGINEIYNDSRFYPMGEAAAPLIGVVGLDSVGLTGIERSYDNILKGKSGKKIYRKDAAGGVIRVLNYNAPKQAPTVQLSINKFDQYMLYSKLRDGVLLNKADSGAAVLIKIDTGEILAMASYPSYNPNNFDDVTQIQMRDVAINDSFEPGSTVKPLVIIEGLERNIIQPNTLLDTMPYSVNGHLIRDVGHWSKLTPTGILQKSSDIGVSHIALAMPAKALVDIYQAFGLGKPTGLGLTGESVGYFPLHRRQWANIERATFSFGYGLRVTPLQIAREYATIGSYGIYRPLSITKVTPPVMGQHVANPEIVKTVVHMMESDVLPGGSGVKAAVPGYRLATKTGTAEKLGRSGKYNGGYVNYTAGFAPASHPVVALVVMVNNPRGGAHFGGSVAAPIFGKIMGPILKNMNIAPDALVK